MSADLDRTLALPVISVWPVSTPPVHVQWLTAHRPISVRLGGFAARDRGKRRALVERAVSDLGEGLAAA